MKFGELPESDTEINHVLAPLIEMLHGIKKGNILEMQMQTGKMGRFTVKAIHKYQGVANMLASGGGDCTVFITGPESVSVDTYGVSRERSMNQVQRYRKKDYKDTVVQLQRNNRIYELRCIGDDFILSLYQDIVIDCQHRVASITQMSPTLLLKSYIRDILRKLL